MSFLFWHLLADHLDFVLDNAIDAHHTPLRALFGICQPHVTLPEYELGPQGFGSPDGSVAIDATGGRFFTFVEAKDIPFMESYQQPPTMTADRLTSAEANIDRLCRQNCFNSTINGQLELRWRFTNAFQAAVAAGHELVTEQRIHVPSEIVAADRFYWRHRLQPTKAKEWEWRRVDMEGNLNCLYRLMRGRRFLLLAVTADQAIPDFEHTLRLFDDKGKPVEVMERVFWLSRQLIEAKLQAPHP
jgi:hypothetical protein